MECFQTCVDKGNKCFFSKEKLTCVDCGKYRKGYTLPPYSCSNCHQRSGCQCPEVRCECAETSCLEWFLSLFGLGQKKSTKDTFTCTQDQAGENKKVKGSETEPLDIAVCRSKEGFAVTLQRIGSKHKCERSKSNLSANPNVEGDKKFKISENYQEQKTAAQASGSPVVADSEKEKEHKKKSKDKSPKFTSSNSSNESRGRSRRRKNSKSRSRSGSYTKNKDNKAVSRSSSGSRATKGRSRSCSSSICSCSPIFKPYRHKYSYLKCSSYTPQTSAVHHCEPLTVQSSLGQKYSRSPSKLCGHYKPLQAADCSPPKDPCCFDNLKESTLGSKDYPPEESMSCAVKKRRCTRGPAQTTLFPIYSPCGYFCRLPCRSQSFHTTMVKGPSPRAVCLSSPITCCVGDSTCDKSRNRMPKLTMQRKSRSCPRSCPCPIKSSCCSPPPCFKPCCPKPSPCVPQLCPCGCKAIPCPPTCTKQCCLPCPRKFQVSPYCSKPNINERLYSTIPKCITKAPCSCPPGGCLCAKSPRPMKCCNQTASMNKPMCGSGFNVSYLKSKQGDAICQQLLTRYGFAPAASTRCSQPICTGMTFCPNPCNTNLCKKGCMCNLPLSTETKSCCAARASGCRSCRPYTRAVDHRSACEPVENYTNSRKPVSPGGQCRQIIWFNNERCSKPPRREFHLAPHCLRKTGPRSPVQEYMYKMFVPKKKLKDESFEDDGANMDIEEKLAIPPQGKTLKQEEASKADAQPEEGAKENEMSKEADSESEEMEEAQKTAEVEQNAPVSKKKKSKRFKKKTSMDENASAVNDWLCPEEEETKHDVMMFVCELSPPVSVKEDLDEQHLELYSNNNHGCEHGFPRHAHFSQAKFYPGFRLESPIYDPYSKNAPLMMSAFATSKEIRPSSDPYRSGTYSGPSFGYASVCHRSNKKDTKFDEAFFCTSRLSKNWNVNTLNTSKYRTATWNLPKFKGKPVMRNCPKALIHSQLESEIRKKIDQIKIHTLTTKSNTWRKQQLQMPAVVPVMNDEIPTGEEDDHSATGEFISAGWKTLKHRQSIYAKDKKHFAQSGYNPGLPQHAISPQSGNQPRHSVYSAAQEPLETGKLYTESEAPKEAPESNRTSCTANVVCTLTNEPEKDTQQSNCNHDQSCSACISVSKSGLTVFRKDILSPERPAVPAAVPMPTGHLKHKEEHGIQQYGRESSVDVGDLKEPFLVKSFSSVEAFVKTRNENYSASIKKLSERDSWGAYSFYPDRAPCEALDTYNSHVAPVLPVKQCSEVETIDELRSKYDVTQTSVQSCSLTGSYSSVTSSTTLSVAGRSSAMSTSNVELTSYALQPKFTVVTRIASIPELVGVCEAPKDTIGNDPVKFLVRSAFVPKNLSDVFHDVDIKPSSPLTKTVECVSVTSRPVELELPFIKRIVSKCSVGLTKYKMLSGSSVDPEEINGNESQNHASFWQVDLRTAQEESDQLLSSSRDHILSHPGTENRDFSTLPAVEPKDEGMSEPAKFHVAEILLEIIRHFGTPV